jgi:hypothetical protein
MTGREINRLSLSLGPALAALALATGASSMTPRLIEPSEIAGEWRLKKEGGGECRIRLTDQPVESVGGYAVELGDCGSLAQGLSRVTNWRASSDGVALAQADRTTVLFLSRHNERMLRTSGQSSLAVGGTWTLTR